MYKKFIVDSEDRLDKFLSKNLEDSRNQILQLIKKNLVKVDNKTIDKNAYKLKENQTVEVEIPKPEEIKIKSPEYLLDFFKDFEIKIIYEDEDILVLNKPANLTVHEASSVKEPTLVDWLKLKKFSLSTISGELRHGIVHRLDKGTSGILVVAKTNEAHQNLSKEFENRNIGRYYLAIIDLALKDNVVINRPIARNPNNRLKMGIVENGKDARTAFCKIESSNNQKYELIACKLFTGRTHQIRVHLNSISRHILGDTLYGFKSELSKINRIFLHAYYLEFMHPIKKTNLCFKADIPKDIENFIDINFSKEIIDEKINPAKLTDSFSFVS